MLAKKWKDYCMGETLQKIKLLIINNAINPEAKKKKRKLKIRTHKFAMFRQTIFVASPSCSSFSSSSISSFPLPLGRSGFPASLLKSKMFRTRNDGEMGIECEFSWDMNGF